ncbi:MAG: hypothetical protein IGR80_08195 [Synechococcales cyanobacterium K44_A2020_017]|nr:hypothetical protein [Synechococcales cyanobacterium K32_A2020_035]MBF2094727.1 hypothetical protein [Synechococcales cyanobacterium K44_A2020_017]
MVWRIPSRRQQRTHGKTLDSRAIAFSSILLHLFTFSSCLCRAKVFNGEAIALSITGEPQIQNPEACVYLGMEIPEYRNKGSGLWQQYKEMFLFVTSP